MQQLQKLLVFAAGKLAPLIGVEDGRCAKPVYSVPYRLQDRLYTHGIGEIQPTIFLLYQLMVAVRYMWLRRSLMYVVLIDYAWLGKEIVLLRGKYGTIAA